jgi:hypothetical protein
MPNNDSMPMVDPRMSKDSPEQVQAQEESERLKGELEIRMGQLKEWYPEWFTYSDTLGERPIDGMMRELRTNYQLREEQQEDQQDYAGQVTRNVEQNWQVAPEYTEERQMHVPPGMVEPMGKVM